MSDNSLPNFNPVSWAFRIAIGVLLLAPLPTHSQVISPLQGGHYSPAIKNTRDMATPPPGLFVLWYNTFFSSSKYIDANGDAFESIRLSELHPVLPDIDVDLKLKGFASIPTIFWASDFDLVDGAKYMAGISFNYITADASIVTERGGIIIDTTYTHEIGGKNSGFSDMFIAPLGLSWGLDKTDFTFLYGFYAPTGKYEAGSSDVTGLGFWTHQFQGYGYYYPVKDRSSAIFAGVTYEVNSKIKDADVRPGNRLSLEWGLSQFLSEKFEVGIMGGHNWQVSDDSGEDVYWDKSIHDRKSTLAFNVSYWPVKERLMINAKYGFDYGIRQRFKNNSWLVNILYVPGVLNGKHEANQ